MKKRILVAPLNWGIGHACRCIPIIEALLKAQFEVVIASDNEALLLLKKEFPKLEYAELPSYNVSYSKTKALFKSHLLKQLPKIYKAIKAEHKATQQIINDFKIDGIISDNRLGVYSKKLQSVFITHQLQVLTGNTTYLSTKVHNYFIKNFNTCWVPDFEGNLNLSGKLSHTPTNKQCIQTQYIGALSRLKKQDSVLKNEVLILLSGPEPQRSILENLLLREFKKTDNTVLLVEGKIEKTQVKTKDKNVSIINYLTSTELEEAINASELVICRSGYTSIMDLAKLNKKAFLIPTPGQFEQEYLAQHLETLHVAPYCNQVDFNINELKRVKHYKGFASYHFNNELDISIFNCFI